MRLHGMAGDIRIVAHIGVVEVRDLLRLRAAVEVEVVERRSTGAHHCDGWQELREDERDEDTAREGWANGTEERGRGTSRWELSARREQKSAALDQ